MHPLDPVCVFAGPSLPIADRAALPGVTYLPSAGRGDVARAAERYRHVILIDGVFGERLAASPREVAEASARTRVYGAASMGALRSAECRTFGCTPLGIIARWYASGTIDGDDEVAIVMHPTREVALSVPSVNVRYVARLAVKRGLLSAAEAKAWVRDAREKIFYADRNWENAVAYAPLHVRAALVALGEREGNLKRMDARFALRCVLRIESRERHAEPTRRATTVENARMRPQDDGRSRASASELTDALRRPAFVAKGSIDRCRTIAEMLELVPELCRRFAITRIADLTHLDRTRVPVMNAVVPYSADLISTYNGKGATRDHAIVGAVMEAVERQAAAREPSRVRSFLSSEIADDRVGLDVLRCEYVPSEPIPYVQGIDLATLAPVWLPQAVVTVPFHGLRLYRTPTTNGVASGSSRVEATHQALFEVIERHIFSLSHFRAHVMPRLALGDFFGTYDGAWTAMMVDEPIGKRLVFPTGDRELDDYAAAIREAGLDVSIAFVQEGTLPSFAVSVVSETSTNRAHLGMTCSWSSRHAAWRAITEAMQSRVGDTSGAREDLTPIGAPGGGFSSRYDTLPNGRWFFDGPHTNVELAALPEDACGDLAAEIALACEALRKSGIGRVYAVDLSRAECPVAIVRIVAPDVETAALDGRVGPTMMSLLETASSAARAHFENAINAK